MNKDNKLSLTEDFDFASILELMVPMYYRPEYAWLPELMSIVGYQSLIRLCKVAGGEKIMIPTIDQLSEAVEAMDWYYRVWVTKRSKITDVPPGLSHLVEVIARTYEDASNRESIHKHSEEREL